jgi:hypothetical protein
MHINGIPFLVTTASKHIHLFGTVEAMENKKIPAILKAVQHVASIYKQRGFHITWAFMNNDFQSLRGELADMGIGYNEAGRDRHVPQIEQYIQTVKERMRATFNMLPFTNMPSILMIEMVWAAVFWLNAFPYKKGMSTNLSPQTMVTGQMVDYTRHCQ